MSRWRGIVGATPSVLDASASAGANFAAGLIAVAVLPSDGLALYALIFSAAVGSMTLPQQMAYLPHRIHINKLDNTTRTSYLRDFVSAAPTTALAVTLVCAAGLPLAQQTEVGQYWILTASAAAWVVVSPLQDHVRASLHISGEHLKAALISGINLSTVTAVILAGLLLPFSANHSTLLPFGLLVMSNMISAIVGMMLHRGIPAEPRRAKLTPMLALATSGSALVYQGSVYTTNTIVALLLSAAALAELEAARIVAQPVFVIGAALLSQYMPDTIRHQHRGNTQEVRKSLVRHGAIVFAVGTGALAILPAMSDAVSRVVGRPVDGLLAGFRAISFSSRSAVMPLDTLAIAAGKYLRAIVLTLVSSLLGLLILVASVPLIGVYAVPTSMIIAAATRALPELPRLFLRR
ncbi:hypothetical protein MTsN4n12_31260 [Microbacterium sp. MTN4-12]